MTLPLFFGRPERRLYGMHHRAQPARDHMLMCAPLLHEGMRCHRALWALAEALARAGISTLRFDWYGSGDSAGESDELTLQGMLSDLAAARTEMSTGTPAAGCRLFAVRGAALPLLAYVRSQGVPARIVLWDPVLVGDELVAEWRQQHAWQLTAAGRFTQGGAVAEPDELLGFDVDEQLLGRLARLDALHMELPAGSEVLLATWDFLPSHRQFVESQQQMGIKVEVVTLDPADRVDWQDRHAFELQAFPRRSVSRLAGRLAGAGA
ncbi:MAG: hypothetical protein ACREO4_14160 [Lysobacter sp.]